MSWPEADWLSLREPWDSLVRRYVGSGYSVFRGADVREGWLSVFEPDLVANKGDEWVVVEVKRADELTRSPELFALAKAVEERPHWRMELFVVGRPESTPKEAPDELDAAKVRELADRAIALRAQDPQAVGPFFLAAAYEAAARALVSQVEPETVSRTLSPSGLSKALLSHGFINDDEHVAVMRFLDYRNLIAHGYGVRSAHARDIDTESEKVVAVLTRILAEMERGVADDTEE